MVLGLSTIALTNLFWTLFIFVCITIFWTINYMVKKNYPYEIIIHADLHGIGKSPISSTDRARLIPISKDGTKVLWLRKNKIARPFYGNFVGNKKIAYVVEKGNWFNIIYSGVDKKLNELGVEPMDIQSQKLVGQSIKTILDGQFPSKKMNTMTMVMVFGVIIVLGLSGFILYKNIKASNESANVNLEIAKLNRENLQTQASANLNFTESIKDVIAEFYRLGVGSGARQG